MCGSRPPSKSSFRGTFGVHFRVTAPGNRAQWREIRGTSAVSTTDRVAVSRVGDGIRRQLTFRLRTPGVPGAARKLPAQSPATALPRAGGALRLAVHPRQLVEGRLQHGGGRGELLGRGVAAD